MHWGVKILIYSLGCHLTTKTLFFSGSLSRVSLPPFACPRICLIVCRLVCVRTCVYLCAGDFGNESQSGDVIISRVVSGHAGYDLVSVTICQHCQAV